MYESHHASFLRKQESEVYQASFLRKQESSKQGKFSQTGLLLTQEGRVVLQRYYLRSPAVICGLFVSLALHAATNPLDVFLDGLETFSADFEQQLIDSSGEVLETSKGSVLLRRPGMFSWSYSEPYTQEIISDGKSLWVYEEDLEQVTISDANDAVEDTPALIFSGRYDIAEHYVINELEDDAGLDWLELTPRNLEAQYRSLRLAFSGAELSGMILFDSLGQTLMISFENTRRNPELNRELFRFTPAENIDIIDARKPD